MVPIRLSLLTCQVFEFHCLQSTATILQIMRLPEFNFLETKTASYIFQQPVGNGIRQFHRDIVIFKQGACSIFILDAFRINRQAAQTASYITLPSFKAQ